MIDKYTEYSNNITHALAEISDTNPDDWYLVSRARHGMSIVFDSLQENLQNIEYRSEYVTVNNRIKQIVGGPFQESYKIKLPNFIRLKNKKKYIHKYEVITQAFTCVTAVNPILDCGFRPKFLDIDSQNLSLIPSDVKKSYDQKVKACVVQHTFGIQSQLALIRKALPKSVVLIEDSAHRPGFVQKNESNQVIADISLHSFGFDKMLATKFGAAIYLNPDMKNKKLRAKIISELGLLKTLNILKSGRLDAAPLLNKALNVIPNNHRLKQTAINSKILIMPVMPKETRGMNYDDAKLLRIPHLIVITKELQKYQSTTEAKIELAQRYKQEFPSLFEAITPSIPYLRLPIICKDETQRESLEQKFKKLNINIGRWYRPLLFPGVKNEKAYDLDLNVLPNSKIISERIINIILDPKYKHDVIIKVLHEYFG